MEEAEKQISSLIRNLGRSELGKLLAGEENCLNIRDTIDQGGLAYFALSPFTLPALSDTLGKLMVNDLKASLYTKVLLTVDEFTTLAASA